MHRRQAEIECRRRSDDDPFAFRQIDETPLADEREQFVHGLLRGGRQLALLRVIVEHVAPDIHRRPAGSAGSTRAAVASKSACAFCSSRWPIASNVARRRVDQFFGSISRLDVGRSDGVFVGRRRQHLRLELARRTRRWPRRAAPADAASASSCSEGSATPAKASGRSCARRSAAPRNITIARSTNSPRRTLQVLARRREELRHRRQLRRRLLRPCRRRRRLHRHQVVDAVGDRRRVDHRVARPGADGVEIEEPAVDHALQDPPVDALVRRSGAGIDRVETPAERAQPVAPPRRWRRRRSPRGVPSCV